MHVVSLSLILLSSASIQTAPTTSGDGRNVGAYKTVFSSEKTRLEKLVGHVPPLTQTSERIAPMDAQQQMTLTFVLPYSNQVQLEETLAAQNDPQSPSFHKYLTPEQFAARFHPSDAQVEQTFAYLRAHGLQPQSRQGLLVKASGAVAVIETLLHTEMFHFAAPDGSTFFAPAFEVQLPVGSGVVAVDGLSDAAHPHHHAQRLEPHRNRNGAGTFSAQAVRQAYNIPSNLDGTGQTLALLELDGYSQADIAGYAKANNLPQALLTNIVLDGYNGKLGDGAGEVTLDIEVMMALAPNANILVYEAPNTGRAMSDIWNEMANPKHGEKMPTVISCSWGISESYLSQSSVRADNAIFKQMAAQGQSVFAAAGDAGAYDDGSTLSVDEPAAQPYVIGVGGTALFMDGNAYGHETTWLTGGGGISRFWATPSWQKGHQGVGSLASLTHRNVPDVSLNADPNTGYQIYFQGRMQVFGGTSCAAPLWAAFVALANQERAAAGSAPLGFLAPTLYALGSTNADTQVFHDISDSSKNGWYPAVTGYDDATGLGSFNGAPMLQALSKQP